MKCRIFGALAATLVGMTTPGITTLRADGLAEKLPGSTVFYAELDLERLADSARRAIRFVDPDLAGGLESDLSALLEIVKELAGAYEFDPSLVEKLLESKLYFVVMAKREPLSRTVMRSEYSYNQETEEFEEKKVPHTVTDAYTESFIIDIGEDAAARVLTEIKGFLERRDRTWRELEVEEGELIAPAEEVAKGKEEPGTIGRRGSYVVWANGQPKELWRALASRPEPSFAESPLYRRYKGGEGGSLGLALLNIEELVSAWKRSLDEEVEAARRKWEDTGNQSDFLRQTKALGRRRLFQSLDKVLGLRRFRTLGANVPALSVEERLVTRIAFDFRLGSTPPPGLRQLLDGGHEFEAPPVGDFEDLGFFLRTGFGAVMRNVIESLDDAERQAFEQYMALMKSVVGYTAPEIVEQLAGDLYVFVDVVEKEVETPEFNEDTEEFEMKTRKMFLPEFSVLLGLEDREVFGNMLSAIITRLSSGGFPISQVMQKRVYQGEDVYVFGIGKDQMKDPDGLQSFALVLADRYLTVGSWREATALVRRAKAADEGRSEELASVLRSHPGASLLLVAPREFVKKVENLEEGGVEPAKLIEQGLEEFEKVLTRHLGDEALSGRLREVLERMAKKVQTLDEKWEALSVYPEVVHGKLAGQTYEVRLRQEVRKP